MTKRFSVLPGRENVRKALGVLRQSSALHGRRAGSDALRQRQNVAKNSGQPPNMNAGTKLGHVRSCASEKIFVAKTAEDFQSARELFENYARSLNCDLGFQDFATELKTLPGDYAPPGGCILLAKRGTRIVGCVALRPWDETVCEMKRLYVKHEAQGSGIGRTLAETVIVKARALGYKRMRLDTLSSMRAANRLYASLGFCPIEPYRYNPLEGAQFYELFL